MSLVSSQNFVNDRVYTLNSLIEELALLERHIRDGSVHLCDCLPEKHLPLVSGLASEGFIFAESSSEKSFMARMRDKARVYKDKIKRGELRDKEAMNELASWARGLRHAVEARDWGFSRSVYAGSSPKYYSESKSFLRGTEYSTVGTTKMTVTKKEILGIDAGAFIGKGASMGWVEVDKAMGKVAAPVHLRPSTYLNLGVGALSQFLAFSRRVKAPWDLPLAVFGAMQLTMIVDYAGEALAGAGGVVAAARVTYPATRTYTATYPGGNSTVQTVPMGTAPRPRYTITA